MLVSNVKIYNYNFRIKPETHFNKSCNIEHKLKLINRFLKGSKIQSMNPVNIMYEVTAGIPRHYFLYG